MNGNSHPDNEKPFTGIFLENYPNQGLPGGMAGRNTRSGKPVFEAAAQAPYGAAAGIITGGIGV